MAVPAEPLRVALVEAGSPGLNIYSHVSMGRGTAILATVVRDAGFEVRGFIEDVSGKDSIDWDFVGGARVVGFSAITCTLTRTRDLVSETRRRNPAAAIVLGGPEPTCAPQRAFEAGADYVIRGEGEFTLPEFLRKLAEGADVRDVPGVCWMEDGALRSGPPPRQLTREEVSALPLVDESLVAGAEQRTTGLVWRSRGCPERCGFCEVHEIWPRYVLREEETSVEELVRCQEAGRGGAFLIDDNAAANKPSFKRFLRGAIERGFSRPIAVQLRADAVFDSDGRLDHELLRLLRDLAPTTMVCVGVESADDAGLLEIGKRDDSTRMAAALKAMRGYGLLVHGMFIALAGDTVETLRRNGRYARRYVTSLQYLFETPLPGTKRTAEHERAGRVIFRDLAELRFLDGMHVSIRPENMSPREMQDRVLAEYRRFYSRVRLTCAFLGGLLLRYRRLGPGHRAYLRTLGGFDRLREWAWLHLQFKFAPWVLLRIGRRRVLDFLHDTDYAAYRERLEG
ncbi:MAG: B12-binding domain-containing radical SAM protein [Coriobacteriia bacterium]|nr:B12-binding domain-containing radical SAM protein [Coriobacteriia bacterium]